MFGEDKTENNTSEFPISKETAEEQMNKFLSHYDIIPDNIKDEDQRTQVEQAAEKITRMIRRGFVEMNFDNGCTVKHTTQSEYVYTYKEMSGMAKAATSKRKDGDHIGKLYSLMGYLSGSSFRAMADMKSRDMTIVDCLGILFLSA